MNFIVIRKGPIDLKSFVNSGFVEGSDDIQPSILKSMFSVVFLFLKHVGFHSGQLFACFSLMFELSLPLLLPMHIIQIYM